MQKAVLDSEDIHMILDLSACAAHRGDKPGPAVPGSVRSDRYMIQHDETMAFATTHFTVRPDHTPVEEFLAFRVQPNGRINAHPSFLSHVRRDPGIPIRLRYRPRCDIPPVNPIQRPSSRQPYLAPLRSCVRA
jgi:hypothetical protein